MTQISSGLRENVLFPNFIAGICKIGFDDIEDALFGN